MEISSLGLLMGLLLLALPLYIVFAFDLRLLRRLGMSLVSMAMVVVVLGAVVGLLSRYDKLWLNIVAGVVLALLSSVAVVAKCHGSECLTPAGLDVLCAVAGPLGQDTVCS